MATLETLPEAVPFPRRKRWTVEEYDHLTEAGFLPGRYELIAGEIIEKMTPNPPHVIAVTLLAAWLQGSFSSLHVRTQAPVTLPGIFHRPEPDIALTREPVTAYLTAHPAPNDLLLVAEVSDSTMDYDLGAKAALYATAGITDYWVLDIAGRRLIVQRQPGLMGYQIVTTYSEAMSVAPLALPEASIVVSALFPPSRFAE